MLAMLERYPRLSALYQMAQNKGIVDVAVAYPCDENSLSAVWTAYRAKLIRPILVGPKNKIAALCDAHQMDFTDEMYVDCADNPCVAATIAAGLCRDARAQALMKGSLHTDELLSAAVSKEANLRSARRASHCFVLDVPHFTRPLLISDAVVNIQPDLMAKKDIAQNAIDFSHKIGIKQPKVAILSAVEVVNPSIASTLDAAALCKMADRGQIVGATLDGPLAYDNAISYLSAQTKGIQSHVAGHSDILLVPGLEVGNMLYKQLVYMAGAECAGLVLGMKVPVILTSRADSVIARVVSCALAVLAHETH